MVTEWNRKAAEMLAYTKDEAIGKHFVMSFIQPENRKSVSEVLANAQAGKETANYELSLLSKKKERYTVLLNATTRRDGRGEVIGVVGVGQDITELNQVVANAKLIADDLTRLIETANAPIFGIDTMGKVTEWNAKSSSLLGFEKRDAVGKSLVANFITDQFKESVNNVLAEALVGKETANFEFPMFTKYGERRDILLNATARRGPNGEITGVIGVGQDITGIREIMSEQERIADDLSRLIDSANAPIFGVDVHGMVTEWNRKAAEMLAFTKEEAISKHLVMTFIQPENRRSVSEVLAKALRGVETANFELPLLSKHYARYTVLLNATTRRDAKGNVTGVVGVGQDITELNQVMADSKRIADDLTRLIDTANAPIFGIDKNGKVNEWNAKASSLLGFEKADAVGKSLVVNFITDEYKESVNQVLTQALLGQETANFEFPMFTRYGERKDILLNATTRRGPDGEITGVIGVGQDITGIREVTSEQERIADDLSRLIDNANAPIFGVDVHGMVTEWNRKAAEMLGYTKSEAMGTHLVSTFIQPENQQSVSQVLLKAQQGIETANFELPLLSILKKRYTVLLNATTRRDAKGNVTGVVGVGQDITELNQVMANAKLIADDLTRLIETANAPIFGIDIRGKVTEWNAKASNLLGFSKSLALGRSLVEDFIKPEFQDAVNTVLSAALTGVETANFVLPLWTKDGERREILLNATTRRGPNGEVTGVIGVGQDITLIREATAEQERIADDLSRLIECANAPIFGVDVHGMVTEWNRKAADILGYEKAEAIGKHLVMTFIQPENRQSVSEVLAKAQNGVETANFELSLLSKHGEQYTVLLNATTRRDAKGNVIGVVGVGQDITELNTVMAESKRVADDLTRLIETANAPIFGIDTVGNVREWNAKASSLLGVEKSEALGKSLVATFITSEFKDSVDNVLALALVGKETANFEFPMFTKNGERKDLLLNATTRRGPNGEITGVIGVGQDITRIREVTSEQERIADDLSRLIDTANAPIFGVDVNGMVTEWNRKAAEMLAYTKDEAMGKHLIMTFIQPENRQSVSEVLEKAMAGVETANFELPLISKKQKGYTVLLNATTRRDAKGNVTGVVGVGQDITELNQVMADSKRIADDLTRLIETANAPIFGIDTRGQVTEWNAMASSLLGYSGSEAIGKSLVSTFITDEFKQSVNTVLSQALVGKETANFEFPLFTKHGERKDILLNATTRRGPDGEIIGVIGVGQDITQIRVITDEHRRIADDLSLLIETANAPIFGVDLSGMVSEWNRKAADILGYSKQETLGKSLVECFIQPEYQASVDQVLKKALAGEDTANYELPMLSKHGKRLTVLLNATTRRDVRDAVTGVLGVGQDVTELLQVMAESEHVADDLTRLIETANAPIFGIDTAGRISEWNRKTAEITGFSKAEARGKNLVTNFIHLNQRVSVSNVLAQALAGEETSNYELPLYTKGGQRRDILLNATTRRSASGEVIGVVGVGQDITELKNASEREKRIADDLTRLIETANAPIFGIDTEGNVTEWNAKATEVSGYNKADTIGKHLVNSFIHLEYRKSVSQVLQKALGGKEVANFELTLFTKDGQCREILLNATPRRGGEGGVVGVVGVGQDITELNQQRREAIRIADDVSRILETANAPIFGVDVQGRVNSWNLRLAELSQYSKDEAMGKSLVQCFVIGGLQETVGLILLKALNEQPSASFELPMMKDGEQKAVLLMNATTRRGPNREVIGVICVGQDITQINEMTAEQRRIAEDLARLIDSANAPIFGVDVNGMVTEWNRKAGDILGYTKQEAIGQKFLENFIQAENRTSVEVVLQKALSGKETANYTLPLMAKNGTRYTVLLNATTRRDAKGNVTGVVGVGQDITELNQVMAESKQIADDLTRLIETANAPILGIDKKGNVTEWNAKASSLLGYTKEETLGKNLVGNFITEEFKESVNVVLASALLGKETANFEFPFFTKTGQKRLILLNATARRGPDWEVIGVIGVGQDITQIREITSEQERVADDLSRLIETANAPIFGVDMECMITEWNRKAADMMGYSKEEAIGKQLIERFIQVADQQSVSEVLQRALTGVETANFALPLLSKFGKRYTVLLNATTRRDAHGKIVGVVGVGQDITQLNKVMAESKRTADDLTRLIETANAPIFGIDTEGKVTEWNAKASNLLGFTKQETIGKSLVENFITEEFRSSVGQVLTAALRGHDTANFEFLLFTKSGERREILLNATARRGPDGEVIGVIGVGQDITRIREVTSEQERIADDLSRLIETANAPIFGVDLLGMVTEWNRKAADILGFTKAETLGKNLVDGFIRPEHRNSVREVLQRALTGQETANYELPLVSKDGKRLTVLLNATTRRDGKGRVIGVVGVGQNITQLQEVVAESKRVADGVTRLIETANAPILGVDKLGRITEWNKFMVDVTGVKKEAVLGQDLVQKFIPAHSRQKVRTVLDKSLNAEETPTIEFPIQSQKQDVCLLMSLTTRRGSDNDVVGTIGVGQDVTALTGPSGSTNALVRVVDAANAPILSVDKNLIVTEWNQFLARVADVPSQKAKGQKLLNLLEHLDGKTKVRIENTFKQCLGTVDVVGQIELRFNSKDPKKPENILLFSVCAQQDLNCSIYGAICIGQDTTPPQRPVADTTPPQRPVADTTPPQRPVADPPPQQRALAATPQKVPPAAPMDPWTQMMIEAISEQIPAHVRERVRKGEFVVADHSRVSMLASDIVDWNEITKRLTTRQAMSIVRDLFEAFETLTTGLFRVESIGCGFLVIAGLDGAADHAEQLLRLAFSMLQEVRKIQPPFKDFELQLRIGMHVGPIVAGVLGKRPPRYQTFGQTLARTALMENHGAPGCIHFSAEMYEALAPNVQTYLQKHQSNLVNRGVISVGGADTQSFLIVSNSMAPPAALSSRPVEPVKVTPNVAEVHQQARRTPLRIGVGFPIPPEHQLSRRPMSASERRCALEQERNIWKLRLELASAEAQLASTQEEAMYAWQLAEENEDAYLEVSAGV
eukprot:TRINITY_DN20509_c0_g2_i1.p1 TRINITY_DN20509_c0_g2~~TRINITY_DN20509_c0_g2_i1.p1  ORF type:complete len:3301 (-),score=769.44 TRINITY_DN20509_c0_g2_i1:57-9083(-)